ncbi:hypothetical protein ACOMHN_017239 [Nucella lapillus]
MGFSQLRVVVCLLLLTMTPGVLTQDDDSGRAPHITKPRRQPTGSSDQKAPEAADGLLGLFPLMHPALRD